MPGIKHKHRPLEPTISTVLAYDLEERKLFLLEVSHCLTIEIRGWLATTTLEQPRDSVYQLVRELHTIVGVLILLETKPEEVDWESLIEGLPKSAEGTDRADLYAEAYRIAMSRVSAHSEGLDA